MKVAELLFSLLIGWSCVSDAASPTVSNIVTTQREGTKLVDIYYDSYDQHGDNVDISVVVKVDGTPIPAENFHGDIGMNLRPGTGKQIIWDAGSDWDKEISPLVTFEITADDGMGEAPPAGMVFIPGGTNGNWIQSFYMDETEITKAKWDEVREWALTNDYSSSYLPAASAKASNHPVHSIPRTYAICWCNARSEMEGRSPIYYSNGHVQGTSPSRPPLDSVNSSAGGFRLPTFNEFVYAGRGGLSGKLYPSGDTISLADANFKPSTGDDSNYGYTGTVYGYHPLYEVGSLPYTSPVKSFPANGYGLYDMAGNVREWSNQAYNTYSYYTMGGSWKDSTRYQQCERETYSDYRYGENYIGFRCMCR
ncbi:formylglycine-generating enzyme family protein [Pontiella agarivorans]|uniref:SUMF1/EgtB/PvdO family nonheme iron enzyme n=1 Tax=Pontiella agarivorans TaxID=3038953 RepID=A0ABU5MXI2_9BACT|nr:SUMF1/EgtB/PvdO family nonheme iron enzyme [Pontiella agarivorans]MDZ8118882.1 SUMF1/EgtB/PvdO family nonheme iron enzyme [Pontiella agarivorans]